MSLKWRGSAGLLCALLLVAAQAQDIDPLLWRGLDIQADPVPGTLWFNDIALQAVRFTGRDMDALLQRWFEAHRGQKVQQADAGEWRIHTALDGARSEVLQVREGKEGRIAIWSVMTLGMAAPARWRPVFSLPAECRAGPEVRGMHEGEEFRQRTATCRGTASKTLVRAQEAALRSGLRVARQWSQGFEALGSSSQARILVTVLDSGGQTRLVTVERRRLAGGRQ